MNFSLPRFLFRGKLAFPLPSSLSVKGTFLSERTNRIRSDLSDWRGKGHSPFPPSCWPLQTQWPEWTSNEIPLVAPLFRRSRQTETDSLFYSLRLGLLPPSLRCHQGLIIFFTFTTCRTDTFPKDGERILGIFLGEACQVSIPCKERTSSSSGSE